VSLLLVVAEVVLLPLVKMPAMFLVAVTVVLVLLTQFQVHQ
jgi:hypothetical protein